MFDKVRIWGDLGLDLGDRGLWYLKGEALIDVRYFGSIYMELWCWGWWSSKHRLTAGLIFLQKSRVKKPGRESYSLLKILISKPKTLKIVCHLAKFVWMLKFLTSFAKTCLTAWQSILIKNS